MSCHGTTSFRARARWNGPSRPSARGRRQDKRKDRDNDTMVTDNPAGPARHRRVFYLAGLPEHRGRRGARNGDKGSDRHHDTRDQPASVRPSVRPVSAWPASVPPASVPPAPAKPMTPVADQPTAATRRGARPRFVWHCDSRNHCPCLAATQREASRRFVWHCDSTR